MAEGKLTHQRWGDTCGDGTSPASAHIAAFDPPTVLALLTEVEQLRAMNTKLIGEKEQ